MNRAGLSWALNAVIPHAKKPNGPVGLRVDESGATVYSTDTYTLGAARIATELPALLVHLSMREASELMRFVRPSNKAEQEESVELAARLGELHVATANDSAVFDALEGTERMTLDVLDKLIEAIARRPDEYEQCVYNPDYFARFAKAKRADSDRLYLYPKRSGNGQNGVALVNVGDSFYGAISAVSYDSHEPTQFASLTEGKSA